VTRLVHGVTALLAVAIAGAGAFVLLLDPMDDVVASRVTGIAAVTIAGLTMLAVWAAPRARVPLGARLAIPVAMVYAVQALLFTVTWPARDPEKSPRAVAEAAAALTPEAGSIGLVGDRALAGGLVYYGGRRVTLLQSGADIERFFDAGGAAVVVQARKLSRVEAVAPVEVQFRAREGRRQLVVATRRE
jgi:hypothetical protein